MSGASKLYRLALQAPPPIRRLAAWLRMQLIGRGIDPVCTMEVHGRKLAMPLSHALPSILQRHKLYDSLPGRLATALRRDASSLRVVDVGANVGDTLAALGIGTQDHVLAIEPNPSFARFIGLNWPAPFNVRHVACLCTAKPTESRYAIQQGSGTASFVPAAEGTAVRARTLDELLAEHTEFASPHLLKIDTDGHDFEVIEGAAQTLTNCQPVLLFECDIFGRPSYATAVMRTMNLLADCGYPQVLVYDHVGHLHGRYDTRSDPGLANLLFHQCLASRRYFDVVAAPPTWLQGFLTSERTFFELRAAAPASTVSRATLADAAELAFADLPQP